MLAISKETTYALSIMLYLVKHKGSYTLEQISKDEKLPYKYLTKLVLPLKKAGLLEVKAGRNGGYKLGKKPIAINLREVLELFERKKGVIACLVEGKKCLTKNCLQRPIWELLEGKLLKEAEKIRLKDMLKN